MPDLSSQSFTAALISKGPGGGWTHVLVPFDVFQVFGSRGRIAVAGTLNGVAYRSSIMPEGDGTHYLNITKALMKAAGVKPGDQVTMTMAIDRAERIVDVPEQLTAALKASPAARSIFEALAYSHRKQYADWIASAKREETRHARALKAVERLQSTNPRFD